MTFGEIKIFTHDIGSPLQIINLIKWTLLTLRKKTISHMPEKYKEQTFKTPQNSIIRIKTMGKGLP